VSVQPLRQMNGYASFNQVGVDSTKVRLLNRLPTLDLAGRDYSSCPQSCLSKVADQNVSESAASVRRERFDGFRIKKRRPQPPPIDPMSWYYIGQIFQITPVPGICTSAPLPVPTTCVSSPWSRTAP
jgi:hypothetical protein